MTTIALDAMGGDFAPRVPVEAAVRAARTGACRVVLVGDAERLAAELARHGRAPRGVSVHHCTQAVGMDEPPSAVLRDKADASVRVAFDLAAAGEADAVLSAGHSGAIMVAGKHVLGTLEGVDRPAIATPLPLRRGVSLLLDSGANADCKPRYLLQFAVMGEVYARTVLGLEQPRVALLNIGAEPGKGNELARESHELLERAPFRFVGNVEGRDLFRGKADVLVTDGFVGNLVLKTAEAANNQMRLLLREAVARSPLARLGFWLMRGAYRDLEGRTDYRAVGGSLLLGLNGVAVVGHGASNARALTNALQAAARCAEAGLVGRIGAELRQHGLPPAMAR